MWIEIFSMFVTDHVAFLVHVYLLTFEAMATVALGFGIIWESSDAPPSMHKLARRIVLWACVTETVCGVALFTFDEGISEAQQDKIVALEERIADRGLLPHQYTEFVSQLAPFAGTRVDVLIYGVADETRKFSGILVHALNAAKWQTRGVDPVQSAVARGVSVAIAGADEKTQQAGAALLAALKAAEIEAALIDRGAVIWPPHQNFTGSIVMITGSKP